MRGLGIWTRPAAAAAALSGRSPTMEEMEDRRGQRSEEWRTDGGARGGGRLCRGS